MIVLVLAFTSADIWFNNLEFSSSWEVPTDVPTTTNTSKDDRAAW
jgi:hypothetical protein